VLRVHSKIKRIYELNNAADKLGLLITEGPHKDTQDLQVPVFRWFNRFLKGEDPVVDMAATKFFSAKDLKVFAELPNDERTSKIHETFVPAAKIPEAPKNQAEWEKMRDDWKKFLAEKVFAAWPTNLSAPKLKLISSSQTKQLRLRQFEFVSQENIVLPIYVVQSARGKAHALVIRVLDETESKKFSPVFEAVSQRKTLSADSLELVQNELEAGIAFRKEIKNSAVAFVFPRGIGPTAWTFDEKKATQIRRRFMLLGTTLDAMRVWDIRRATEALTSTSELQKLPAGLSGTGMMGVNALYAALFVPQVKEIQLTALPASQVDGPDYLNVLKSLDLPQVVAMAAERSSISFFETDSEPWKFSNDVERNLQWSGSSSIPKIRFGQKGNDLLPVWNQK
jgi:hypothetical protein